MSFKSEFYPLETSQLSKCAMNLKELEYRFVQMLCINTADGIDLLYSFMKDDTIENYTIKGVKKSVKVPSISTMFLEAFVFENEAHDLFGVEIEGIVIDFKGKFYHIAENEPMTVITPEKRASLEKAAKIAQAKVAQKARATQETQVSTSKVAKDIGRISESEAPLESETVAATLEKKRSGEAAISLGSGE